MLLKVRCDKCNTKYKLDDSRIQGKGAKITCPRCGNVFVVMKPVPTVAPGGSPGEDPAETATVSIPRAPSDILEPRSRGKGSSGSSRPAGDAVSKGDESGLRAMSPGKQAPVGGRRRQTREKSVSEMLKTTGPLAKLVKRPKSANDLDWKEVGITTFKVKVGIGLVYDFSDVATLKKYIAEKRVVETDRVSFDGKVWTVLKDINSVDEFFIDQWVALKLERMLEEEREAEEAGLESPLAKMLAEPTPPPGDKEPLLGSQATLDTPSRPEASGRRTPAAVPTTGTRRGDGSDSRLEIPDLSALKAKPAAPPPPPPGGAREREDISTSSSNGLSASDLFGDVHVPEETHPVDVPVNLPANRPSAPRQDTTSTTKRKKPARPVPRRSSQVLARVFDAIVVLLLAVVAGYLGWRYYAEGKEFEQADRVHVDPLEGIDQLDALLAKHFPISYAASQEGQASKVPVGTLEAQATPTPQAIKPTPRPATRPVAKKGSVQGTRKSGSSKPRSSGRRKKGHVVVSNITAEDLYQVAVQAVEIKNYPMAVDTLKKAVEMKPRNAKYHYLLGYAYYRSGKRGKALETFQETLALRHPPNATHKWLGEIYAAQGNKKAAIEEYQKYLKGSPGDAETIRKKIAKLSNS